MIVLLFLAAIPVVFVVERGHSETEALAALDAFGRNVAADQQRRFVKIAAIENKAAISMRKLMAAPRPLAAAAFNADFPMAKDGTRRSRPALFDGEVRPDGSIVTGVGAYISHGDDMPAARLRTLLAAFDSLQATSGGIGPELTSLYFFTPDNDIIIHAPGREDRLRFYRQTAPASLNFQQSSVARIMTPANNPDRRLRCTDLEEATYDPSGKTWTTGCMTPMDIAGRHIGSWGVSLLLHELFAGGIPAGPPGARTVIVSKAGRLIFDPALTVQSAKATGRHLDLTNASDPRSRALWAFIQAQNGKSRFTGLVPQLDAYVALNPVETPGWHVVTYFPRKAVVAQSLRAALTLLAVGLIVVAALILLIWQLMRRTVGEPLLALAVRAEDIAARSGHRVTPLPIDPDVPEEVARLSASFDAMEDAIDTERKRLKRSFDLLAQSVQNHAIYMLDRTGRIINWNRGAESMTGFAANAMLGQSIALLVPDDGEAGAAAPSALQQAARANGRAIAEGWRKRRDGSRFWASIVTEAIMDEAEQLIGFAEIMRDISDDRQQRLQLEESLRLLTLAEDMAAIGHWRYRIGQDRVEWSAGTYRIHGVAEGTAVTMAMVMEFYAPAQRSGVESMIGALIKDGKPGRTTSEIIRADGVLRRVVIESRPERDEAGDLVSIFGVMRDITEESDAKRRLTEAREAADAAAQARAELLTTVSHEIRTPMTGIIGMLDLMAETGGQLPESMSFAGIARSARTLMVVLDDVLEHSRMESGALRLESVAFDLGDVIEQTAQMFRPLAAAKGVTIIAPAAGLGRAKGDPSRLQQILSNLVGNAVKFTAQGSVRVAGTRLEGDVVRIEVHDSGIGIAADVLPKLFTPFQQAEPGIARTHGGTGLGLSISRRLAEAMGGRIGVTSTPGVGSCFWLELGLPIVAAGAADTGAAPVLINAAGAAPRVLVVEDNATTRQVTEAHLQALGCDAVLVADGMAALAHLFAGDFDVVLMDNQLPVLDGAAAIGLVRLLPGAAGRVAIIGFTAGTGAASHLLEAAGADGILPKPFDRQRLAESLGAVLSRAPVAGETDPASALQALLASLPAAARAGLAKSVVADVTRQSLLLVAALSDADRAAAQRALHALAGLGHTLGDTPLAARCAFGEALVAAVDPALCQWLGTAIQAQTDAVLQRVANSLATAS
ncbi:ATP-binding protein [Sandarakinorhabdus sp.]|uniref:ATP-binding protein n=1 Tax=Sandarakinorhabdus sp. TaxID=1916663 RepID=UPI00334247A3